MMPLMINQYLLNLFLNNIHPMYYHLNLLQNDIYVLKENIFYPIFLLLLYQHTNLLMYLLNHLNLNVIYMHYEIYQNHVLHPNMVLQNIHILVLMLVLDFQTIFCANQYKQIHSQIYVYSLTDKHVVSARI